MKGVHWEDSPTDIKRQALLVKKFMEDFLGDALTGLYVHGSLCLGAYYPGRSDLDMLAVVNRPLSPKERNHLMLAFLHLHRRPAPIELSIMVHEDLKVWKHPAPYQFHFSDYWRKRYAEMAYWEDESFWQYEGERSDPDLACHVTLARQFGIALHGPPLAVLSSAVPGSDLWHSLRIDAEELMAPLTSPASDHKVMISSQEAIGVLTLARIWSFRETGLIYSKLEAAEWAMPRLPEKLRFIVKEATAIYLEPSLTYSCLVQNWNELREQLLASCPLSHTA